MANEVPPVTETAFTTADSLVAQAATRPTVDSAPPKNGGSRHATSAPSDDRPAVTGGPEPCAEEITPLIPRQHRAERAVRHPLTITAIGIAVIGLVIAVIIIKALGSPASHPGANTSSPAAGGHGAKLTVKVVQESTNGQSVSGSRVKVLQDGSFASVASGSLNQALEFAANVPSGQYQVCIDPPIGYGSAVRGTHVLSGWICTVTDVRASPVSVTFRLSVQAPAG